MSPPPHLQPLQEICRRFRQQLARLLAIGGVARLVCVAVLLFGVLSLIDWRAHWSGTVRLLTLALFLGVLGFIVRNIWRAIRDSKWTDREVLHYLGIALPEKANQWLIWFELLSARDEIQELQSATGTSMAETAIEKLSTDLAEPDWSRAFDTSRMRQWFFVATGLIVALLLCATLLIPEHVRIGATRLFLPFSTIRWPHRTMILVKTPEQGWTVPQLEAFPIVATVTGEVPPRITLSYRTAANSTWVREKIPVREDGSLSYTFAEVREPVELYLEGGDYQTDRLQIDIVQRPFLKTITAHYSYPTYAGLPDRSTPGGQLAGLEGTKVRLEMESSMPLDRAVLVLTQDEAAQARREGEAPAEPRRADAARQEPRPPGHTTRVELQKKSATQFAHEMMLATNGKYAVELYEPHGYREAKPEVYEIRVTPDDPPEVELLSPGKDLVETNQATIEVSLRARDQLGLSRVAFFYQLGEEEPKPLGDLITGPIPQTGLESTARFTWELRKIELPESGNLTCFARVRDNNPTGRGQRDSLKRQIKLVRPSEFHLEAVEQAKLLEEEARIAWKNQLQAWQTGSQWLTSNRATPLDPARTQEADPLWSDMNDSQQRAFQATRQVRVHLQTLTEKYERNHMAQDFMAGRLSVVAELLTRLQEKEHAPIGTALTDARPKSAADAAPDRLRALRSNGLTQSADHQKLSVLILERMLRKLYDWRDLQTATITTKLLHEQQDEVLTRTEQVAPKTIAKEIEDLTDQDQDRLLTLGKQQRAIFDTETGLEQQLTYMMYKAEKQARKTILDPLRAAFTNLRNNRVNDHLKQSAELIANNQPSQIINSQKAALRALKVVQAGLITAGQKVDDEQPLTLAMIPTDAAQFDPDQIKPAEVASKEPDKPDETSPLETPTTLELPTLPEGSDALSAAVRLAIELEDNVLARTRYLDKNHSSAEMPRFVRLKLLRLSERQTSALEAITLAQENLKSQISNLKSQISNPKSEMLTLVRDEFQQSLDLLHAAEVAPTTQQIQADAIETLRGVLQNIALMKAVEDATAENRRLNGLDGFNRQYLLRGADLDYATELIGHLHHARQRQAHAQRLVARFAGQPAASAKTKNIEKQNRQRAADSQRVVGELLVQVAAGATKFSTMVPEKIRLAATGSWSALNAKTLEQEIVAAKTDATLANTMRDAAQQIDAALIALRDSLEERIRPEPTAIAKADDAPKMTMEEYQRLTSPEHLANLLKQETSLPPELRDLMIRSLQREDLPPKYRQLITAYYASFIKPAKAADANGTNPPSTKKEESGQ